MLQFHNFNKILQGNQGSIGGLSILNDISAKFIAIPGNSGDTTIIRKFDFFALWHV